MKALDDVFQLLGKERRRYALYYLREAEGPVPVEELAEQVAAWENGTPPEDVTEEAFEDVSLTLVHRHLPRAAEAKFVEYDHEERVVRLTGSPAEFGVILSVAKAIDQPSEEDPILQLRDLL